MKHRIIVFGVLVILALLMNAVTSHAWTGDTWGPISRETILRIADEMIDFSWTPKYTINNWNYGSVWYPFSAGTVYRGEAYSQHNPQENWAEFYNYVNNITGGNTYYGNDCSGFVSMSWRLPTRYTTTDFAYDATHDGGYVTSLGDIGSGEYVGLLLGDAFVTSGHIILFEYYLPDGSGIKAMEQTPSWARRSDWNWTKLASYRPIRRNDVQDYVFTTKWGSYGSGDAQFNYPTAIDVDLSGYVYVADSDNDRIQKFNSSGGFITKWGYGSWTEHPGSFLNPYGIAVDSSGYVYVTDTGDDMFCSAYIDNQRVQKFNSSGAYITEWGTCIDGMFHHPYGIAVDSSGYVYVADTANARIRKFNSNGGFITMWGADYPSDIVVDSQGNIYVTEPYSHRIKKFTSNGGITTWGSNGSGDGQFDDPRGIAVDSLGDVYVADSGNDRIQKFNSSGGFITKWGSLGFGDGQFIYPLGIAVDLAGNVYVADTANDRIQKFLPYPSAPSNLTATAVSSSQINLSWQDNSNNETGFKIKRKTGFKGTYSTIATVGANVTSCSDIGLTGDEIYYYAVWAYNSAGESAYSNEANATIGNPPADPSNLTATALPSPKKIILSWQDNSNNETGFKVERKTGAYGTYSKIVTVVANITNCGDINISEDVTYYYRVNAFNNVGDSAYSNEANAAIVTGRLPAAPSNLTVGSGNCFPSSQKRIYLSWTDNSDNEEGFKIERKRVETGGIYSVIGIAEANRRNYSRCESKGYTYCYRVKAYNVNGNSDYSNEVCINIP